MQRQLTGLLDLALDILDVQRGRWRRLAARDAVATVGFRAGSRAHGADAGYWMWCAGCSGGQKRGWSRLLHRVQISDFGHRRLPLTAFAFLPKTGPPFNILLGAS